MMERTGWGEPCTSGPSSPGSGRRDVSAELPVWTNETVKHIALRGRHPPAPAASWDPAQCHCHTQRGRGGGCAPVPVCTPESDGPSFLACSCMARGCRLAATRTVTNGGVSLPQHRPPKVARAATCCEWLEMPSQAPSRDVNPRMRDSAEVRSLVPGIGAWSPGHPLTPSSAPLGAPGQKGWAPQGGRGLGRGPGGQVKGGGGEQAEKGPREQFR